MSTRLALAVLAALLALPIAHIASPVEAKWRWRTVTRTFANPAAITLPVSTAEPTSATLYPSTIEVDGLKGTVRDVNLRLYDMNHNFPGDVEMPLVGSSGQTAIVMANVGSDHDVDGVTLGLDEEAAALLPETTLLHSGTYRPTNTSAGIDFKAPAPSAGANAALSVFDGDRPNGEWRLFVQNQVGHVSLFGFAGGWELEITSRAKGKKKRR